MDSLVGADTLSFSLPKLQRLAASFVTASIDGGLGSGDRDLALRLTAQLGVTVLPLCLRELASGDEHRAHLAAILLVHLADDRGCRSRVAEVLYELAHGQVAGAEPVRRRARRLLGDLGVPDPRIAAIGACIQPVDAATESAATPLDATEMPPSDLRIPADVASVANGLVSQLDGDEMIQVIDAVGEDIPGQARVLVDELLLRDDVDERCRSALKRLRVSLDDSRRGPQPGPIPQARSGPGDKSAVAARLGQHPGGRTVVVASHAIPGSQPRRLRVLCALVDADGTLVDGLYGANYGLGRLEQEVLAPLRQHGYCFTATTRDSAARMVCRAARTSLYLGHPLPREFYLGRDLLGLYDEHTVGVRARDDGTTILGRARDLLATGRARQARPILERYVSAEPDRAEGAATLAQCLIDLGDLRAARTQLLRAIGLDPENPLHHWNLAAVVYRQGRRGYCYLALRDYLDLVGESAFDQAAGACAQRAQAAQQFAAEYERVAALEYPDSEPVDVARADDLLYRARLCRRDRHCEQAIAMLDQCVAMVPGHYPGWAELGAAHSDNGDLDAARRCLHRALHLRPGYAAAQQALAHIDAPTAAAVIQMPALTWPERPEQRP